jgi:hypothetical protein
MRMLTRRAFLASAGALHNLFLNTYAPALMQGEANRDSRSAIEAWMNQWMYPSGSKQVEGALFLSRFREPIYFLTRPISWRPNAKEPNYPAVTVPVGFVTDLASIPAVFWSLLRPDGTYTFPAIIHDYLYWRQTTDRKIADDILNIGMKDFQVENWKREAIYNAVRTGGGHSWKQNTLLRRQGEKRLLKVFPDDPRISWTTWKSKPGAFGDF